MNNSASRQYIVWLLKYHRGNFINDLTGDKLVDVQTFYSPSWNRLVGHLNDLHGDMYWFTPIPWEPTLQGMMNAIIRRVRIGDDFCP